MDATTATTATNANTLDHAKLNPRVLSTEEATPLIAGCAALVGPDGLLAPFLKQIDELGPRTELRRVSVFHLWAELCRKISQFWTMRGTEKMIVLQLLSILTPQVIEEQVYMIDAFRAMDAPKKHTPLFDDNKADSSDRPLFSNIWLVPKEGLPLRDGDVATTFGKCNIFTLLSELRTRYWFANNGSHGKGARYGRQFGSIAYNIPVIREDDGVTMKKGDACALFWVHAPAGWKPRPKTDGKKSFNSPPLREMSYTDGYSCHLGKVFNDGFFTIRGLLSKPVWGGIIKNAKDAVASHGDEKKWMTKPKTSTIPEGAFVPGDLYSLVGKGTSVRAVRILKDFFAKLLANPELTIRASISLTVAEALALAELFSPKNEDGTVTLFNLRTARGDAPAGVPPCKPGFLDFLTEKGYTAHFVFVGLTAEKYVALIRRLNELRGRDAKLEAFLEWHDSGCPVEASAEPTDGKEASASASASAKEANKFAGLAPEDDSDGEDDLPDGDEAGDTMAVEELDDMGHVSAPPAKRLLTPSKRD